MEEQVDGIAMVPRNEVTVVMGEKMVRVKNEGEVGGGFVVEGQKERIVAISKNSDSLVDEVVVIYENGYLWKIHIIERKVKWFLIGTFNFVDIVYSINLDQKDRPVYIGIATSSFVGLIDIENQNNNHLFTSGEWHTTYTSSGVNCIHGGISFNHKYQDEYAFYYNNAKGIFVIGYIFIESKFINSIKAIAFTIDIISSNIDKNYKIYSFGLNKIFLISSDTLIFIRDFNENQATTLKINKNAIIKSNVINVSIYIDILLAKYYVCI